MSQEKRFKLLIVDDDKLICEQVEEAITESISDIAQIMTAYDSKSAKTIISKSYIDLMICDIEMPGGSGLELLKWMRESHYDTLVIFLTSYASFSYSRQALKLQSYDFLLKPISNRDLVDSINKAIHWLDGKTNGETENKNLLIAEFNEDKEAVSDRFWTEILTTEHGASREYIERVKKNYGLDINLDSSYLLILIHFKDFFGISGKNVENHEQCRSKLRELAGQDCIKIIWDTGNLVCVFKKGLIVTKGR